jgi:hypothetical protein
MYELGWEPAYTDLRAVVETAWRWHRLRHGTGFAEVTDSPVDLELPRK